MSMIDRIILFEATFWFFNMIICGLYLVSHYQFVCWMKEKGATKEDWEQLGNDIVDCFRENIPLFKRFYDGK